MTKVEWQETKKGATLILFFFEKCLRVFPRPGSDQEKYDEKRESDENEGEQEYGDTSFCDNHDCGMSSPVG